MLWYLCPSDPRRAEDEEAAQLECSGCLDYSSSSSDESQRESDGHSVILPPQSQVPCLSHYEESSTDVNDPRR